MWAIFPKHVSWYTSPPSMSEPLFPLKSGSPRHEQISSWIREQIEQNIWGVDDQLPSENRLGQLFSVSRITVRRALQTLESETLIYKRQGLGSFVQGPQARRGPVQLTDFVDDMAVAGLRAHSKVLLFEAEQPAKKVMRALGLTDGQKVVRLDRLRFGNDEPIAFDSTWLPAMYARLLVDSDLASETIYTILERDFDIPIKRERFQIEAVNSPNDIAGHLNIPWGRALLVFERTSYSEQGQPVYFQQRYYRCDRVAYELEAGGGESADRSAATGLTLTEFVPVFKLG
ncbi:MAG: GntR family transcriptional regulator [Rhodothermia bacterium]|nr:MAG: GntR family transcriptional regulator [Rhodothermia bacterium]